MLNSYKSVIENTAYDLTIYSNTTAFIMEVMPSLNWAGFYFAKNDTLYLGPFVGKVACTEIPFSKGVCGKAASTQEIIVVDDVHLFEGHIACDSASESEIVLPLIYNNELIGVLDIDSPIKNRFTNEDKEFLQQLVEILLIQIKKGNLLP